MKPLTHPTHNWGISKVEMIYCTAVQLTLASRKQDRQGVTDAMELLLEAVDDEDVTHTKDLVLQDTKNCDCPNCARLKKEFNL